MPVALLSSSRIQPVSRAAELELSVQRDAAAQALDCMQRGLIVANERCELLYCNRTAQKILQENDGLSARADGLHAARPRDSADLRGLVRHAAGAEAVAGDVTVFSIWRPSLKRILLLRVTPLHAAGAGDCVLRRAALFLHDPAAAARIDEDALCRLFGLTHSEARLLVLLLNGSTLAEACATLGVTMNTARTHLKHIFLKTDTNRQTQLISLLLGSVIQLPDLL